ncbi:hypothetical protein [Spongiactinospora gelatinilytica]
MSALLIRPDGHLAWSGPNSDAASALRDWLGSAAG